MGSLILEYGITCHKSVGTGFGKQLSGLYIYATINLNESL